VSGYWEIDQLRLLRHLKLQPGVKIVYLWGGAGCNVAEAIIGKVIRENTYLLFKAVYTAPVFTQLAI
jgi:hypothetical protein